MWLQVLALFFSVLLQKCDQSCEHARGDVQKRPHLQHLSALGGVKPFCCGFGKLTLVLDREHEAWGMKLSKKFSTGSKNEHLLERTMRGGRGAMRDMTFSPHLLNVLLFNLYNLKQVCSDLYSLSCQHSQELLLGNLKSPPVSYLFQGKFRVREKVCSRFSRKHTNVFQNPR